MTKKTALYDRHVESGAKMVEFAGYWMPIQYSSMTEEHLAVRKSAGLFDVSHMGEFIFKGAKAGEALDFITVNNVSKLEIGQVQYSAMCYENGGIVDDLLVYRFKDKFMTVVNASNLDKDFDHMKSHIGKDIEVTNISDDITLLALQGPESLKILSKLTGTDLEAIQYYWFAEGKVAGIDAIISRTGYTGESGFELYIDRKSSVELWDALFEIGAPLGLKPVGLGSRDSLRLEMKYCLYGNDIDENTNPLEAGLGWITKLKKKSDFIGKPALIKIKDQGLTRKLIGFELEGRAFPRHHYPVFAGGSEVSEVASGIFSPSLKKGIGTAYLPLDKCEIGSELEVDIRGKRVKGKVVETPFYKPE